MSYEINVSKNGQHYFATAERSITSEYKAFEEVKHFQSIFPESEGFEIILTKLIRAGQKVDISAIN